jgi:hypothetical protein
MRRDLHLWAGARVVGALILTAVLISAGRPPSAQGILGAATFGAALQIGLNKAGDLIRQAREAGNDLLLGTGVEIQNAITSAQIAYESSLNKTIAQLDAQERKVLTDVDSIIQMATAQGAQQAHDLLSRTQLIANTVPFAAKIPQVAGYYPHFVVPAGETIRVDITGNFPFGFSQGDSPVLLVDHQPGAPPNPSVTASSFGTTFMTFNVPRKLCRPASATVVQSCSAALNVPWDASRWYDVFGRRIAHGMFKLELGVLPLTPGSMTLAHQGTATQHEDVVRRSDVFTYDSSDSDIEENRSLRLTGDEVAAGWRIVPNSAAFELVEHIEGVEGHDWYNMGYQGGSDTEVIWRARTERKHIGSSGKIRWRIVCHIARNVTTTPTVKEDVALTWALTRSFDYPAGQWKATWTRFDGASRDITKTDIDSSYLQIVATGDSFRLTTFGF